jgi:hypothetical protein
VSKDSDSKAGSGGGWMPLSQMLVRAGPNDLVALVVRNDMDESSLDELLAMADGITDSTGTSVAIFPEGVLSVDGLRNYSLVDLVELRDQVDETIRWMADRQSVGEA